MALAFLVGVAYLLFRSPLRLSARLRLLRARVSVARLQPDVAAGREPGDASSD